MSSNKSSVVNDRYFYIKTLWKNITLFRETTLIMIIFIISLLLKTLSPHFLTSNNILSTAIGLAPDGIIVVGMTIVLVSGGFDFSVGSVMALSGVITGVLYINGVNIWLATFIAIIAGMLCGFINGILIGRIGLSPFITTLALMGIVRGCAYVITQGYPVSIQAVPASFQFLGQGKVLGLPVVVVIFLVIAYLGDFMMRKSEPLRKVFYIGSNENAAILSGIDTVKVKVGVYVTVAILASIAGVLSLARFTVATITLPLGADASMRSISAAIIGGTSLSGGEGSVFGAVLGLILLNLINNGLILLNTPVYWQDFVNGTILIAAVTLDYFTHKNRLKKLKSINKNVSQQLIQEN